MCYGVENSPHSGKGAGGRGDMVAGGRAGCAVLGKKGGGGGSPKLP